MAGVTTATIEVNVLAPDTLRYRAVCECGWSNLAQTHASIAAFELQAHIRGAHS